MDRAQIDQILTAALDRLIENDAYLLQYDVSERSITHRLAVYLEELLPDWHVDCEYNRHDGLATKRISLELIRERYADAVEQWYKAGMIPDDITVYPDIIVHHRGHDRDNLLVVEAKKTTSGVGSEFDLAKLDTYRAELGYQHAVFVRFVTGESVSYKPVEWR